MEECLNSCKLIIAGFIGPLLTWNKGLLKERLNRVTTNQEWLQAFHSSRITNIALPYFDHYALWVDIGDKPKRNKRNYFKFLGLKVVLCIF